MSKIVHVVGTGTIGEPLIGFFADFKRHLGIDEITFHKRTPMTTERAKVSHLMRRGANLAVDSDKTADFEALGHKVSYEAQEALERAKHSLLKARSARPRPHLDDKTITAWNGLMISAFARAGVILREAKYIQTAARAAEFVRARLYDEKAKVLKRRFRDGQAAVDGFSDDFANLSNLLHFGVWEQRPAELLVKSQERERRDRCGNPDPLRPSGNGG